MSDETGDDRLLADLARSLRPDPVPSGLVDRADALFAVRDLDTGLAELLEPDAAEPAGVRGGGSETDRLTFEIGGVTVEITVERDRVAGRVLVDASLTVTLERPVGTVGGTTVGDLGEFAFERPGTGPTRLRLDGLPDGPVRTDWFLV